MALQSKLDTAFSRLQDGHTDDAIRIYTDILTETHLQPDATYMLGAISFKLGLTDQALAFADAVTDSAPDMARGWVLKALSLRSLRRIEDALTSANRALEIDDSLAEAWECAGMALMHYGRWEEACGHFENALDRIPDNANLRGYYAMALAEIGDLTNAWHECRGALDLNPESPVALLAKFTILMRAGYYDLALECCRRAKKHEKIRAALSYGEAEATLITGRFEKGYALLATQDLQHAPEHSLPDWNGQRDANLHVALFGDQGYGDTLQFIRFAQRAAERVGRVIVRIPQPLERLIRQSMPLLSISVYMPLTSHDRHPMHQTDPVFDFPPDAKARCSLIGLPGALKVGDETDNNAVPYLHADPETRALWKVRLIPISGPRIGLVWAGSPRHINDHNRSIPFDALAPFIEEFKPHIVSLQTGPESERARAAGLYDAIPFIRDFADSAALIEELDLVISVDTAPVHLAGGLGKPVWALLPFNPDWRWLLAREDSPWYPSARLFRQQKPGDWDRVVKKLIAETDKLVNGDRTVLHPRRWTKDNATRHPQAVILPGIDDQERLAV